MRNRLTGAWSKIAATRDYRPMQPDELARRKFLMRATAGMAGGALISSPGRALAVSPLSAASNAVYDVTAFGAQCDGKVLDSPAINSAIEAAAAAGGGTVVFPAGTYRCFSIHLKNKVALCLSPGSVLLASDPPENGGIGYDSPESNQPWENYQDFGHNHWHNSLISGAKDSMAFRFVVRDSSGARA